MIVTACAFSSYAGAQDSARIRSRWLDDYPKHIGMTYNADIATHANYIWRGLYIGGLNLQIDGSIGYGGFFVDSWWNIGAANWAFTSFYPEVDTSIGFSRWGLTILFQHVYYFDCYKDGTRSRFFDFSNHEPGGGGITTEWRLRYQVSSKLPLSILWCTRTFGRDGYYDEKDELKRAYSSYLELGYDFALPYSLTLETRLGMTPWKSLYTNFEGDFAVTNISGKLVYRYKLTHYCTLHADAQLMFNPWRVDSNNIQWKSSDPSQQRLNLNLAVGVTF